MGKRHLTPKEIMAQCKAVARESRMAERTPWTAMGIICAYVIMKKEGFKGQRILRITNRVNELEEQWRAGKIDLEALARDYTRRLVGLLIMEHTLKLISLQRKDRINIGLTVSRSVLRTRSMKWQHDTCCFSSPP